MTPRKASSSPDAMMTSERVLQTFRMPRVLVSELRAEANQQQLNLTGVILKVLHGHLTHQALPEALTAELEADREALGMDRLRDLSHVLYRRSLAIQREGPGFDAPGTDRKR
jgi:hypothetical protein